MRRNDDIVHWPKRMVRRQWLWIRNVKPGPCYLTALKRCNQGIGDHSTTTPNVDKMRATLGGRKQFTVNESACLCCTRQGIDDKVSVASQFNELMRQPDVVDQIRPIP